MLRVVLHRVVRWHQLTMGNNFGRPAMPARKWFFHVPIAHLAGFVQWMSGGVYWM